MQQVVLNFAASLPTHARKIPTAYMLPQQQRNHPDACKQDATANWLGSTGFTIISANKQQLTLSAINKDGKILYQLPVKKTK